MRRRAAGGRLYAAKDSRMPAGALQARLSASG